MPIMVSLFRGHSLIHPHSFTQINVQASDLGTPKLTSENSATVTVNVKRNKNCPRFESEEYTKTIDQTQGVNSQVLVVKAVDDDPQVSD